jgi:hypothetical protein
MMSIHALQQTGHATHGSARFNGFARVSRLLSSAWMESNLIDDNAFRPDRMSTVAEPIFVGASSLGAGGISGGRELPRRPPG